MGGVVELLPLTGEAADTDHDLFTEGLLGVLGDADLLFDGAHQLLVGVDLFFGDGIEELLPIHEGFDVVEVVIEDRAGRLLEGVDEGPLDFGFGQFVKLLARFVDEVEVGFPLFLCDAGVLLEAVLQGPQGVQGVDAGCAFFDQGVGEPVDDVAGEELCGFTPPFVA